MSEWKRYTVAQIIAELRELPHDAEVAVEWDSALSLFNIQMSEDGKVVVLLAGYWSDFFTD